MPHPDLLKWKAERAGMIALAYDARKEYHLITDFQGRDSLHLLVSRFERIDYESGIDVVLDRPNLDTVDPAVRKHFHAWVSTLKLRGGAGAKLLKLTFDREVSANLELAVLRATLGTKNHGHSEYRLASEAPLWIW